MAITLLVRVNHAVLLGEYPGFVTSVATFESCAETSPKSEFMRAANFFFARLPTPFPEPASAMISLSKAARLRIAAAPPLDLARGRGTEGKGSRRKE